MSGLRSSALLTNDSANMTKVYEDYFSLDNPFKVFVLLYHPIMTFLNITGISGMNL